MLPSKTFVLLLSGAGISSAVLNYLNIRKALISGKTLTNSIFLNKVRHILYWIAVNIWNKSIWKIVLRILLKNLCWENNFVKNVRHVFFVLFHKLNNAR